MGEFANQFLNTGIFCLGLTLPFIQILRHGLFGMYVLRAKKSPDEIRGFAKGLSICTMPSPALGWINTYDNAPEKAIQEGLVAITYPAVIANIGLGSFFFGFTLTMLFRDMRNAIVSDDIGGGLVAGFWLVFVLWRIIKILALYRVLRAKDRQIKTASPD